MEVSKLSFTKWQWKSVLERIHLDFICKNPTYFNQPLDFPGYFWKKILPNDSFFKNILLQKERQENHIFILRSFFKRKTRLYTYGPSISTNNNIILTLYCILILYLILNHIKSMLKFCNKKKKNLTDSHIYKHYDRHNRCHSSGNDGEPALPDSSHHFCCRVFRMKNRSIEKGSLRVPIPTVLLQTNLNLPTIRYALQNVVWYCHYDRSIRLPNMHVYY